MVPFESTLERDFLSLVSSWPSFKKVLAQPITVPWFDGVRWRRYTPDFQLELTTVPDGLKRYGYESTTYIEVKYEKDFQENKEAITARLDAVTAATNHPAIVVSELFIRSPQKLAGQYD